MGTVLFVDWLTDGFTRYAEPLSLELRKQGYDGQFIGVYMERDGKSRPSKFDSLIFAGKYSWDARRILDEIKPEMVVVFAHRFFDYMFTLEAHKREILVVNFQHGLYMDKSTISAFNARMAVQLMKRKKEQVRLYSKCIYVMNQNNILNTISTFIDLARGVTIYSYIIKRFGYDSNADISFIFGKYWKDYYENQYNETKTKYYIIGYPELEGNSRDTDGLFCEKIPVVCYLAQTSVEDGVIDKSVLLAFLKILENSLGKFNLILKLHPRSDRDMYKDIIRNEKHVFVWNFPEFPICDCYIGHESTVVARALYITNKVLVYRLHKERISPFEQYSDFVCTNSGQFQGTLEEMLSVTKNSNVSPEFEKYMYKNPNGAIKQAAMIIMDFLVKK